MFHRCIIHVIDTDVSSKSASGWLEDTSKVQKYVMSDEDYAKRENTYKQFKMMKQKVNADLDMHVITHLCTNLVEVTLYNDADSVSCATLSEQCSPRACVTHVTTSPINNCSCFCQEDPEWTAEKELCQRKGIPYQAPKQSTKVMQVMTPMMSCLESERCIIPNILFHR